MAADVVKTCACGTTYIEPEWRALHLVGYVVEWPRGDEDEITVEMRDCSACGSTLGREGTLAEILAGHERRIAALEGA